MTVSSTSNKVRAQGNGSTTVFSFTFKIFNSSELEVYKVVRATDEEGTALTLGVDYTVSINTGTDGGSVTYTVAPTSLQDSFIKRVMPLTQAADIPNNNVFREVQVENALDKVTMILQQIQEELDRAIKLPVASDETGLELPAPESNKVIGWNEAGDALENKVAISGDDVADAAASAVAAAASASAAASSQTAAAASAAAAAASAASVNDTNLVHKTGDESIAGVKTFTSIPILPASDPTTDNQAVRKLYVDTTRFTDRGDPASADFTSLTTDGSFHDLDLSSIVPAGAKAVLLEVYQNDGTLNSVSFRKNGNSNGYSMKANNPVINVDAYAELVVPCDTNRIIEYSASNVTFTALELTVRGWW